MSKVIRSVAAMVLAVFVMFSVALPALATGESVVFNTDSQSSIGDERNFVGARLAGENRGEANIWSANEIEALDGKTYLVRIYVHNCSAADAAGTRVMFGIPSDSAREMTVSGFITADGAAECADGVRFVSGGVPFHLEYLAGSAYLEGNGGALELPDSIITTEGALIGRDAPDGRFPGGEIAYITAQVRVVYDYAFTAATRARIAGSEEWAETVQAGIGDEVEIVVYYKNTSDSAQGGVVLKDVLPENLEYVPASTYLYNANHPEGIKNNGDTITTHGINIGSYGPGANGYAIFRAKVVDDSLRTGENVLVAWGQVGAESSTQQGYTRIVVEKPIELTPLMWMLLGGMIVFAIMLVLELILIKRARRRLKSDDDL